MGARAEWRVAIVDDDEPSRALLRGAVHSAGGEVVGEATGRADVKDIVRRWAPDVAILGLETLDGDGFDAAADFIAADCAVVVYTSRTDRAVVRRAAEVGVIAYLLKPLRAAELGPTLDVAVARFREVQRLRRTLEERKVIERAKGTLMVRCGLTEDEAFRRMRRAAMDSRRPLVEIARAVLTSESMAAVR